MYWHIHCANEGDDHQFPRIVIPAAALLPVWRGAGGRSALAAWVSLAGHHVCIVCIEVDGRQGQRKDGRIYGG